MRSHYALGIVLAISLLAADVSLSIAATLTRGPYLQLARPTGVTIRWRTAAPTESVVRWGLTFTNLNQVLQVPSLTTEHVVTLSGLTPGTAYFYSVGTATQTLAGGNAAHRFVTSPPAGSQSPTRVWILGDSGTPGIEARNVRDAYLEYPGADDTDVLLMLGDNAYNTGTDSEYQAAVFDMYPTVLRRTPLWSTRGNHEDLFPGQNDDYYEFFTLPTTGQAGGVASGTEAYYSFDFANIHFVCLDSEGSSRAPGSDMFDWLELDLAATTQTWIVAFWHHPPYTKGSHNSDDSGDSGGRLRDMRQNALPLLEEGGVDLVLTGHSHSYERSMLIDGHYGLSSTFVPSMIVDGGDGDTLGDGPYEKEDATTEPHQGTVYAVAGSSSETDGGSFDHPVMVTSFSELGSMVLDVNGHVLDAVFLDDTGDVRDRFRIVKGTASDTPNPERAGRVALADASPNPFDVQTTLSFTLTEAATIRLRVVDVAGRIVATLAEGPRDAGSHQVVWNGADGKVAAAGVYFLLLDADGETRVKRIVRRDPKQD